MDEESAVEHRAMVKGAVNRESGLRNNVFIVNIGGDANDAQRLALEPGEELQYRIGPKHMTVDSVLAREHPLGQALADDDSRLL